MRSQRTAESIREISAQLRVVAGLIEDVAVEMEQRQVSEVLIHAGSVLSTYLPALMAWAIRVNADARAQFHFKAIGKETRAESDIRRNAEKALKESQKSPNQQEGT